MFCFLHRWNIDRALDESDGLPARTRAHVARCARCRQHHEQQRAVVQRLNQSASQPVPEPPAFLRSRVMNALRAETAKNATPLSVRWGTAAWAPVAVVAAIAMVGILQTDPTPANHTAPAQPKSSAASTPNSLPTLPGLNLQVVLQKMPDQIAAPYDRELKNLQSDLKSAGNYLGRIVGLKFAASE